MSEQLIQNLQNPEIYDHPATHFKLLETHISWVILTGNYAYKIKKPFNFEFLDFSTLEKRKFYCHEEVRLNQLLAADIYLDVVKITGSVENPQINGAGPVIEYAIKMREFPQEKLFTTLLKNNQLNTTHIDQLAKAIADFHRLTPAAAADSRFGTAECVYAPVVQNFDQIRPLLTEQEDLEKLEQLRVWSEQQYQQHQVLLQQRKSEDFIRDCHGDLHLGNIVLLDDKPVLFDRIEFNDDFRWTDVLADIAFIAMDLAEKKQPIFANRLISAYFNYTGDYQGLALLPFYQAYRAIVRAKIVLLGSETALQPYRDFMQLAEQYTRPTAPTLFITHGLTGSGKSSVARILVENLGAIQISSDIERKRLFNLPIDAQNYAEVLKGFYTPEANTQTYQQLIVLARMVLQAGYSVVVDATFLKTQQREWFHHLADELNVPFVILDCQATYEQMEQRILKRQAQMNDPSEARLDILQVLASTQEILNESEKKFTVAIDTQKFSIDELLQKLSY